MRTWPGLRPGGDWGGGVREGRCFPSFEAARCGSEPGGKGRDATGGRGRSLGWKRGKGEKVQRGREGFQEF